MQALVKDIASSAHHDDSIAGEVSHDARRERVFVALLAVLLFASACGEHATELPPSVEPSQTVTYTASGTDSTWNYYSADIVLSMEGDYAGFDQPDA